MGWFGASRDEVWRTLSDEAGADFVEGGFWKPSKVQARVGPWTVTLDTHAVHTGHAHITYTRMRAPFVNSEGLKFTIYRKGVFSDLGKFLGMQDIEIGDSEFDDAFIIKGNDETRIQKLFDDKKLRSLALAQPTLRLTVKDSEGWFGPAFPEDVDELHFQVVGVLKEVDRLKDLFDLFAAVLDRLCRIGAAQERDPGVAL
ncbi:DUF3137 domain-containing protein [Paludisphaera mucosa]|uniref:DUF3137 domain-containing protein n=1 Tax=Paludisphaera mucosa TaxID=3030827 RepID=A0ABT6FFY1_9BACT|nr:DUF3137 domain-containing protein [Paludisphaera mucosa]MDG3006480.1 DUF3137 domain-containing protein [Paludisphaera mucosa]